MTILTYFEPFGATTFGKTKDWLGVSPIMYACAKEKGVGLSGRGKRFFGIGPFREKNQYFQPKK